MSHPSSADDEPKLVVDTDWKEQVAKEKEEQQNDSLKDASADASQADTIEDVSEILEQEAVDAGELPPPPPASFEVLVSLLFTQAMGTLGHMPHPVTGEAQVNKAYAKHYIDTLEMLGEKTEGNLTEEETKMLSEAMHALRMAYVNAKE